MIIPVILSGGTGSRLWPLSRALYPKQFLPLTSERSLLQETVLRLKHIKGMRKPVLICNETHRFIAAEQLQAIGVTADIILEPEGRNTAPAAAIAALYIKEQYGDAANLLILPADHLLTDLDLFSQAVTIANEQANQSHLMTFGVKPNSPETGYGYIQAGEKLTDGVFAIKQFVEKPDEENAKTYLAEGNYYWNSGIFVFNAAHYLKEISRLEPEMLSSCEQALTQAKTDLDFIRLGVAFLDASNQSIDYAVMEHTKQAAMIPLDAQWSDIGSWSALWDTASKDKNNNLIRGDVLTESVSNSYIHAGHRLVAAIGLDDHLIIETGDAVLVAKKDQSQQVKAIVHQLQEKKRTESEQHSTVYRPWGNYTSIINGDRFQVKHLVVKPGAALSLQLHHHRAEHWVVVKGSATVTCGEEVFELKENQSTFIPIETKHRLVNNTTEQLEIIEVQSGSYLGEDDIVRFEDVYHRSNNE
jgi:mannose-1-phosphate guanylyltransferase/mannose-6-phosphate isomerase